MCKNALKFVKSLSNFFFKLLYSPLEGSRYSKKINKHINGAKRIKQKEKKKKQLKQPVINIA